MREIHREHMSWLNKQAMQENLKKLTTGSKLKMKDVGTEANEGVMKRMKTA